MTESDQPKVYIVQIPMMHSPDRKGWVNKYDLSPAREYGPIMPLLPSGNIFRYGFDMTLKTLAEKLSGFTERDYFLALGDPVAIAAAIMLASKITSGKVNMLRFDKALQKYLAFEIKI